MHEVRSILVVDDEAILRSLVARAFRERGYEVIEAGDGVAALEAIQAAFRPFDLVITDSRMPRLDGPHLVERLREAHPTLPIIHLSGSQGTEQAGHGMPADVPTLMKPFNLGELVEVGELLMRGGAASAG
jgi:two-component system, cell cycle sensor histidine kinase and response regulator CckA